MRIVLLLSWLIRAICMKHLCIKFKFFYSFLLFYMQSNFLVWLNVEFMFVSSGLALIRSLNSRVVRQCGKHNIIKYWGGYFHAWSVLNWHTHCRSLINLELLKNTEYLYCIKILAKSLVAQLTPLDVSNGVVQGSNPPLPLYLLNLYCIKMPLVNSEHVCWMII